MDRVFKVYPWSCQYSGRVFDIYKIYIYDKYTYYILNKEIQEFLVKIKMLFLRSLEIFIASREINLCKLERQENIEDRGTETIDCC